MSHILPPQRKREVDRFVKASLRSRPLDLSRNGVELMGWSHAVIETNLFSANYADSYRAHTPGAKNPGIVYAIPTATLPRCVPTPRWYIRCCPGNCSDPIRWPNHRGTGSSWRRIRRTTGVGVGHQ